MKILVISDSHGNLANLKHVLGFAKNFKVDAVIHAGDWNNTQAVDIVTTFEIPLYAVLGNADIDPKVSELLKEKSKKFDRTFLKINLGGKSIGIVHKPSDIKKYFLEGALDIIFCGHLHSKDEKVFGGTKVIRPGALENTVNFAIYNTQTGNVEFVND